MSMLGAGVMPESPVCIKFTGHALLIIRFQFLIVSAYFLSLEKVSIASLKKLLSLNPHLGKSFKI